MNKINMFAKIFLCITLFFVLTTSAAAVTTNYLSWTDVGGSIGYGETATLEFMSTAGPFSNNVYITMSIDSSAMGYSNLVYEGTILANAIFPSPMSGYITLTDLEPGYYHIQLYSEDSQGYSGDNAHLYLTVTEELPPPPENNNLVFNSNFESIDMYSLEEFEINLWENTIYEDPEDNNLDKTTLIYSIINDESCNNLTDFTIENGTLTIESFEYEGECNFQIYVEETVWLDEQQTATSNVINLIIGLNTFNLVELGCVYEVVPLEGTQICYARFENQNEEPIEGAIVTFDYLNHIATVGSCVTNEEGYCDIAFTVLDYVDDFEVFTSAYAPGYYNFIDMDDTVTFAVRDEYYEITEFNIYNDEENFGNPELDITEFFRGEDMYVEFQVLNIDTGELVINESLFSSVTLYGDPNTNTRAYVDFELLELTEDGYYHFALDMIPLDDDYLGNGLVITYVLGDGEDVGQSERFVEIFNNLPIWEIIPNQELEVGEIITIDLDNYASDLEDEELTFNVDSYPGLVVDVYLNDNILQIEGILAGEGTISLSALDSDSGYAHTSFGVFIDDSYVLDAFFDAPARVSPGQQFMADASETIGDIYTYCWDFGDGNNVCVLEPTIFYTYYERNTYTITLTVTDIYNNVDSYTKSISVMNVGPCSDELDNDGDGLIDMDDPGCIESDGFTEFNLNTDIEYGLRFNHIGVYSYTGYNSVHSGDDVYVSLKVSNHADKKIEDIRVTLMSPEIGLKIKSSKFDLNRGASKSLDLSFYVPYDVLNGEYELKVTAANDDVRQTEYSFFYVDD
jgi:hypothetical protein